MLSHPTTAGGEGVSLGDVATFWKSCVQELRFLWEEGGSVPRMVSEAVSELSE